MMSLLLAAAAAAQPTASLPITDPDLHCMAAYLFVAGQSKDDATATAEDRAGIQSIVMYYFGKLDARMPGGDVMGNVMRLVQSPGYVEKSLQGDVERCSKEAMGRGSYLESYGRDGGKSAAPGAPPANHPG